MAKKNKTKEKKVTESSENISDANQVEQDDIESETLDMIEESIQNEPASTFNPDDFKGILEESKPVLLKKAPVKETISLHDAARRYVIGYKEYWFPSIQKMASSLGYDQDLSVEDAKEVLKKWGAKLK